MTLLRVTHLGIKGIWSDEALVDNVNFIIQCGEVLGVIGESGNGESVTCKALMGLNAQHLSVSEDIFFEHRNLNTMTREQPHKIRGKDIAMIMQQGARAFDPSTEMRKQVIETLRVHTTLSEQQIKQELIHYMTYMKSKGPQSSLKAYPYMLSSGMLQRVIITLALALKPKLIIVDEPTTALDTITQYEIINASKGIKHHPDCAMIFISRDLTMINKIADRVVVMREDRVVEEGRANMVLQQPRRRYTAYLLSAKETIYDYFQFVLRDDFNA